MIRKIEDLLLAKVNYEVSSELKYQELVDKRNAKFEEEELPENALDNAIVDLPSWESLEESAWNLIISKGINWKLFVLWLEFCISSEGWDDCLSMINIFQQILLKKKELLDEANTSEKKLILISYFDKAMGRCLMYSYVKHNHPLFEYMKYIREKKFEKLYDVLKIITDQDYKSYVDIYENSERILNGLKNTYSEFTMNFSAIFDSLIKLKEIMDIYDNEFIIDEDDDVEADDNSKDLEQSVQAVENDISNKKFDDRNEAFNKLAQAYEILKKYDNDVLTASLIRKALNLQNEKLIDTLSNIENVNEFYHLLQFIGNKVRR